MDEHDAAMSSEQCGPSAEHIVGFRKSIPKIAQDHKSTGEWGGRNSSGIDNAAPPSARCPAGTPEAAVNLDRSAVSGHECSDPEVVRTDPIKLRN